jgi:preprotein translocase subunit SecA
MEEKSKTASLTEEGNSKVEQLLGIENLYDPQYLDLLHHIYQALKAHHLYRRDVDYMVKDGEVIIVDDFTGRLMPGRRWSDGLHQAIEAKEQVKVRNENQTLATITFQNYFRMYNKMCGMTGTAETEAVEFKKIYNLDVQVIPPNRGIQREDHEDVVYKTEAAKYRAMAKDIRVRAEKGQPVLVGTVSIEKSERLSRILKSEGITHNVLNAKHHEREAEIVAQAGRFGSITIATNMAGRGTDILLGGNAEFLAKSEAGPEASEEQIKELEKKYKEQTESEKQKVIEAGGLYIMGTERHESRRIDNQLRGRAGRQGDPGESQFYLSLEDDLMRIFNGERIQKIMTMLKVDEDEPIVAGMVSRAIRDAQKRVEGHNFDIRKHLIEYDDVMNQQRTAIYTLRRQILAGEDIERKILDMLSDVTSGLLDLFIPVDAKAQDWNVQGFITAAARQFGIQYNEAELRQMGAEQITDRFSKKVKELYDAQKVEIGDYFEQLSRMLLLQTIDQRWKEHLERIDQLKEGINLRAHAQLDPLIEYKKEAFAAFQEMNAWIQEETIEKLLKMRLVSQDRAREVLAEERQELDASELSYAGADEDNVSGGFKGIASRAPAGAMAGGLPFRNPQPQQLSYGGPPDGGDDEQHLNREQRRQMKKAQKKKKLKI